MTEGMDSFEPDGAAAARELWRLHEVAEAAWEIPLESQPPRLRSALARLVDIPPEAASAAKQEGQPNRG
jgi:hypothetical protein